MEFIACLIFLLFLGPEVLFFYRKKAQGLSYFLQGRKPKAELAQTKAYEAFLLEEYHLAVEFYEMAQKFGGASSTLFQRKALAQIKTRDMEGAKESLLTALKIDPENPFAHNHYGFLLQEYGAWEESIIEFQWAIAYKEDYSVAWSNLGVSYYHTGDMEKALDCYFRALEVEQDNPLTLFNIAFTYEKMEEWEQARYFYESYVQKAKIQDPQYKRAVAHLSILQAANIPSVSWN